MMESPSRRLSLSFGSSLAGRVLLTMGVAGAALGVGSVHTVVLCVATAVLGLAAMCTWYGAAPIRVRPAATLLFALGGLLTAYTALQCMPLPVAWSGTLAPHNAEVWARSLIPLREAGPNFAPISEDPTATRIEVLRGVAYLLAFVTALRIAQRRPGAVFLEHVVIAIGVVLAAAALLHPAFGARKLFGLYEPTRGAVARHVAPLMNPNNLAAYLNLAFCLAFSAILFPPSLSPERRIPKPLLAAIALALVATQVWVASRGGVVTMVLGALVVLAIRWLAAHRSRRSIGVSIASAFAAAVGAVVIGLSASDRVVARAFRYRCLQIGDLQASHAHGFRRPVLRLRARNIRECVPCLSHWHRALDRLSPRERHCSVAGRVGYSGRTRGTGSHSVRTTPQFRPSPVRYRRRGMGRSRCRLGPESVRFWLRNSGPRHRMCCVRSDHGSGQSGAPFESSHRALGNDASLGPDHRPRGCCGSNRVCCPRPGRRAPRRPDGAS